MYIHCAYIVIRIRNAIKQLDKQEEKAKNKPAKPKKEKFTAMHVSQLTM